MRSNIEVSSSDRRNRDPTIILEQRVFEEQTRGATKPETARGFVTFRTEDAPFLWFCELLLTSQARRLVSRGILWDFSRISKVFSRARREVTETRVECARHADYTEERVLLACIETNEYISGEFTPASSSLPARGCSYIYIYPPLPPPRLARFDMQSLAPCRIGRRVSRAAYGDDTKLRISCRIRFVFGVMV